MGSIGKSRHWERVAGRKPFIELSPIGDGSAYDTGQLRPANRRVIRNDEIWFYYGGSRHRDITQASAFSWRGYVRAEVLHASDGQPVPGYTMEESVPAAVDRIAEPMRWKDKPDLSELVGRTVRIRFSLLNAELYAFWFSD